MHTVSVKTYPLTTRKCECVLASCGRVCREAEAPGRVLFDFALFLRFGWCVVWSLRSMFKFKHVLHMRYEKKPILYTHRQT